MPDRIVRMGILTSDAINSLSWEAEIFYRRLMNVADDYGRYDGRVPILRAALYPLKLDVVSTEQVAAWLDGTVRAGVVRRYEVDGKTFVEVKKFRQRIRSDSKWPSPDSTLLSVAGNKNDGDAVSHTHTTTPTHTKGGDFDAFWVAYPKKVGKGAARQAFVKLRPSETLVKTMLASIARQTRSSQWNREDGKYIPNPATWLNQERWEDSLETPLSEAERKKQEILHGRSA